MALKSIDDDIIKVLSKIGLEEYEIENVYSRNKYLEKLIDEDVKDIIKYLYTNCKLEMHDIKNLILKNPLILNESFSRIEALEKIYKEIGIEKEKYKLLINNFDKALSLNPMMLADNVKELNKKGYDYSDIGELLIKNPYLVLEE